MKLSLNYFSGLYTMSFASIGSLFPLIGQYLAGIGFTGTQIGIITAAATTVGIVSNPFWGGIYNRYGKSKRLIVLLCLATALLSFTLLAVKQFVAFLLLYILVFFFENPIFPLIDATTIETNYPFGTARKWGAVGFALGIGAGGMMADKLGLATIIPMFAGFLLITALLIRLLEHQRRYFPTQIHNDEKLTPGYEINIKCVDGYSSLLKNKKYAGLLASMFFFVGPTMAHNTYFSFLYIDVGGSVTGMGLALLLMVISEAPFMAWSEALSKRFTPERMILYAMILSALRFLWYGTGPDPILLTWTFFLQGFANGIVLVEVVKYISRLVSPDVVSLAIPLYTALSSNCGTITSQMAGGILVDLIGGKGVYVFYGLFNIIGIIIYLSCGLFKSIEIKSGVEI